MGLPRLNLNMVPDIILQAIHFAHSAPYGSVAFIKSLESHGWDADTQLEHPSLTMGPPLEDLNVTAEEKHQNISAQLKQSSEAKRALIVKVSHVGGHKYAGNCIVSTFQFVKIFPGSMFCFRMAYG